jgi:hypothetical protein
VAHCRRQPWLSPLCRKNNVIEQVAVGGTHLGGPFRRPRSGAASSLDYIPGVPLRSTPGFSPSPVQGLRCRWRVHPEFRCAPLRALVRRTRRVLRGQSIPAVS